MDRSYGDSIFQTRELFDQQMKRINTAIPGVITAFNPDNQTCSVTPAIRARTFVNNVQEDIDLPELHLVPLVFPFATVSGMALTLPVNAGDSCLLVFSQRCIDNWWQQGGVQSPENWVTDKGAVLGARHHDLNDGFAILCGGPLPSVLGSWCSDGIEIRNRARTVRMTVRDSGVEVDGPVTFLEDVEFKKTVTVNEGSTLSGPVHLGSTLITATDVDLTTHKHGGVQTGSGATGVPQP